MGAESAIERQRGIAWLELLDVAAFSVAWLVQDMLLLAPMCHVCGLLYCFNGALLDQREHTSMLNYAGMGF